MHFSKWILKSNTPAETGLSFLVFRVGNFCLYFKSLFIHLSLRLPWIVFSVHWKGWMSSDIGTSYISTVVLHQGVLCTSGDIMIHVGEYHEYISWCPADVLKIPPNVLKMSPLCTQDPPKCTQDVPPMYSRYPHMYWTHIIQGDHSWFCYCVRLEMIVWRQEGKPFGLAIICCNRNASTKPIMVSTTGVTTQVILLSTIPFLLILMVLFCSGEKIAHAPRLELKWLTFQCSCSTTNAFINELILLKKYRGWVKKSYSD